MSDEGEVLPPVVDVPVRGRLLGVDTGQVRVGLAVCDADQIMASPLETYTRRSSSQDAAFFQRLVLSEQVAGIVVGLPVLMSGDEGIQAIEARRYGAWLQLQTGLPVAFHDERCTTSAAEDMLWNAGLSHKQRKARRDKLAAQMLLQGFLDTRRQQA